MFVCLSACIMYGYVCIHAYLVICIYVCMNVCMNEFLCMYECFTKLLTLDMEKVNKKKLKNFKINSNLVRLNKSYRIQIKGTICHVSY